VIVAHMPRTTLISTLALLVMLSGCTTDQAEPTSTNDSDAPAGQTAAVRRDFAPIYSPDGTRIAFYGYRNPGDNGDVYVLDRASGRTVQLTSDSTFDLEPRWSPDGNEIAYTVSADMRRLQTAFVDREGKATRNPIDGGIATWSADGRTVAVNTRGEHGFVPELVALRSGQRVVVEAPKGVGYLGPWTADLQTALYARTAGEETNVKDLYRFNVETGESVQLTQGLDVQARAWSSDYSRICVVGERDGQTDLYVVDAHGGDPEQLTNTPETEYMCAWSPDDEHIAYSKEIGDSVILEEFDLTNQTELPIGN